MKSVFGILALIVAAALVYGVYVTGSTGSGSSAPQVSAGDELFYKNERFGIVFMRPKGYGLTEKLDEGNALRRQLTISMSEDASKAASSSIEIAVFQNSLDRLSTMDWISNTSRSRYKLSDGVIASTTVDGKEALMYRWSDGSTGTSIVRAELDWVYVFSVTHATPQDKVITDFATLIQTVDIGM